MPGDVRAFLREAEWRVQRFCKGHHIPGFVPSDFRAVYTELRALAESDLAPCDLFCEWGSGHGVVTCLASLLGFNGRLQMLGPADDFAWLTGVEDRAHEELGLAPDEYGVVFAYPWPDEEWAIEALFEQCAGPQALLMTYHGLGRPRLRRKR